MGGSMCRQTPINARRVTDVSHNQRSSFANPCPEIGRGGLTLKKDLFDCSRSSIAMPLSRGIFSRFFTRLGQEESV
jgi:hypothetical protein